jgi:hypothetical protein
MSSGSQRGAAENLFPVSCLGEEASSYPVSRPGEGSPYPVSRSDAGIFFPPKRGSVDLEVGSPFPQSCSGGGGGGGVFFLEAGGLPEQAHAAAGLQRFGTPGSPYPHSSYRDVSTKRCLLICMSISFSDLGTHGFYFPGSRTSTVKFTDIFLKPLILMTNLSKMLL